VSSDRQYIAVIVKYCGLLLVLSTLVASEKQIKGAMPLPSGVEFWMKKG